MSLPKQGGDLGKMAAPDGGDEKGDGGPDCTVTWVAAKPVQFFA